MPYSVMLKSMSIPSDEQLIKAFEALPNLVRADAIIRARNAALIVADRLTQQEAARLTTALGKQGVAADYVDEADLMHLPPAYALRSAVLADDGIHVLDAHNHRVTVSWDALVLVAAGVVNEREEKFSEQPEVTHDGRGTPHVTTRTRSSWQSVDRTLIELYVAASPERYRIDASNFDFAQLGDERSSDKSVCAARWVRRVVRKTPRVLVTRGASNAAAGLDTLPTYDVTKLFEREIIWAFWHGSQ